MGLLSNISGKEAVKIFQKFVPNHKELAPELLRGLIRKSGLTVEEFLKAS